MNKENCEEILMALMAVFDGEKTDLSPEQLKAHTANCENCRREIEQMQNTFTLLKEQERRVQNADLWSAIEPRIEAKAKTNWRPLAFLGIFLVVYKLLEMLPERDFGLAFKIVPLVFVVALFGLLKENPFKINTELVLEK
jgi:predicted anti-sigma-YlaC factor YlaD